MVRSWLIGFGLLLAVGLASCSESSSSSGGNVEIVAADDGTVEVVVGGEVLFALAATGPIARNFVERPVGIGAISFERTGEVTDPLSVLSVANEGPSATVEYVNASGSRTATLTAAALDDEVSEFRLELAGPAADSIAVGIRCDELGTFHGFGEQYNATNQRGEAFELLVNEQGNGRDGSPGVSVGDEHTTYFPMPYYIDARGFGALFDTERRVDVDLCASDQEIAWFEVISGAPVQWRVFHGPTGLDVIRQLGELVGRPTEPPAWAYNLWMASQGGNNNLLGEEAALRAADIPVAAFWVQDWSGIRMNLDGGSGVQYVWEPDETLYPGFDAMVFDFHKAGYKFLIYVNPFIVNPDSVAVEDDPPLRGTLRSLDALGLLLNDQTGDTFIDFAVPNLPQNDAHPDFSNPATLEFISESLKEIVRTYDVDGWMVDFGEWVPVSSAPEDGSDPIARRNTFPIDWQRATREAMEDVRGSDWVMFARSGFTDVQGVAQIHWVGDQQTNWGELDGLPTVVPAMLNLGLAGQPFVTHDIAGFASSAAATSRAPRSSSSVGRSSARSLRSCARTTARTRRTTGLEQGRRHHQPLSKVHLCPLRSHERLHDARGCSRDDRRSHLAPPHAGLPRGPPNLGHQRSVHDRRHPPRRARHGGRRNLPPRLLPRRHLVQRLDRRFGRRWSTDHGRRPHR